MEPKPAPVTEEPGIAAGQRLGTFRGVYRPTVLTLLGLMMYVREGWVVGEAGLLGAILIILFTFLITGSAALSLSSITTNIHIGAGGVFSLISRSLGLETGGSIGIPLYMGQALSGALYIYGFTEGWLYLFPGHSPWIVAYSVFIVAICAAFVSANFAFRIQGVVMIIILVSLASIILGLAALGDGNLQRPVLWGNFENASFWLLFAIFFPAGTGVKVGASMSGALADPRRSIPKGTLAAVATALVVYIGMAIWYSLVATSAELQTNRLIVIERAAVGELVIAGLLASTFTATISTLVAAPQVLQALGEHNILPKSDWLRRVTPGGDARNATIATGALVAGALLLGSLDNVAVLITMFFLLIYFTINLVISIEHKLGLISFRPTFRISSWIPLVGLAGSGIALLIISPLFAMIAIMLIIGIYIYLVNRRLHAPWETVRSGMFVSLADWAAKRIARTADEPNERSWKPDLLVPVTSREQLDGIFRFLRLLAEPKGSIKIMGVLVGEAEEEDAELRMKRHGFDQLGDITRTFHARKLLAKSAIIDAPSFIQGVRVSASVMRASAFRPNILFGMAHRYTQEALQAFVDIGRAHQMGVALLFEHPDASLGQEQRINIWITDQSPDWSLGMRLPNLDLSILLALQIHTKWKGIIRLITVSRDPKETGNARGYHRRLIDDARLPSTTESIVMEGDFFECLPRAPRGDLNILGLAEMVDKALLERVVEETRNSCLFIRDSGWESALA